MNIRAKSLFATLACFMLLSSFGDEVSAQSTKPVGVPVVVIDAGHGGDHPGAGRHGVVERDITLKVALKLGKLISAGCPDVKVVYTRTEDKTVELKERCKIANDANGDLFISIHVNAVENSSTTRGTETFILGESGQKENLEVVMRENGYMTEEQAFPGEDHALALIRQQIYSEWSNSFATIVQKHYVKGTDIKKDRGVKSGRLHVLRNTAMPSILTEIGFMTNTEDFNYIKTEKGQNEIAKALYKAFVEYKTLREKNMPWTNTESVSQEPTTEESKKDKDEQKIEFYVQLAAYDTKQSTSDESFGKYAGKVVEKHIGKWYKYCLGGYSTEEEARKMEQEVKKEGLDAFVFAMDGEVVIPSIAKARNLVKKSNLKEVKL
jgi:N-acetylmuramoyl-L-alanine amidase